MPESGVRQRAACENGPILVERSAADDAEAAFEDRLAGLRKGKGGASDSEAKKGKKQEKVYDFKDEVVFYEGSPHRGDLAVNVALGVTLVWLPLTAAAIGRAAFVKYRFTDKRISIITSAPWQNEQTDVLYSQVREVVAIGRGVGAWGDMVITLEDNSRVEIRSLDKWQEIKQYVLEQRDAAKGKVAESAVGGSSQGFS
eukprot:evm.model.scf_1046.2 EVM.evm.TU.scf_1046.2   scf_1046:16695-19238(-)